MVRVSLISKASPINNRRASFNKTNHFSTLLNTGEITQRKVRHFAILFISPFNSIFCRRFSFLSHCFTIRLLLTLNLGEKHSLKFCGIGSTVSKSLISDPKLLIPSPSIRNPNLDRERKWRVKVLRNGPSFFDFPFFFFVFPAKKIAMESMES